MTCLQCIDRPVRPARDLCARDMVDQAATLRIKASDQMPRLALVERIRSQIASGAYDFNGKLDQVLERMIDML
jgi:hypothetical protein